MKKIMTYLLFALFFMIGTSSYGKGKHPPIPFGPPHPELPIDSSISILLLTGALYGAYKSKK